MTRINTNISALTAEQNLASSNSQLQTTLTRLSTGLRINSAADDPAGMIAATNLGANIGATNQAISNSQVAGQMISTADSALSQISSLLTTINGLVTQAANTSSESSSQIAANQLQIDSSLNAINSIAGTTNFQGQNLLDGTFAFTTTPGAGAGQIQNLQVSGVNFGSAATVPVDIHVNHKATQASLSATVASGTAAAATTLTFADSSTLTITAPTKGTAGNSDTVTFNETSTQAAGTASASFNSATNVLTINVSNDSTPGSNTTSASTIAAAINKDTSFTAGSTTGATPGVGYVEGTDSNTSASIATGVAGTDLSFAGGAGASGLAANLAIQVGGNSGSQLFSFDTGTTSAQMVTAINQASGATGVTAAAVGNTLTFTSSNYGSAANVSVQVVNEGAGGTFGASLTAPTANGTDIQATVNGVAATGQGDTVSLNTPSLAFSAALDPTQVADNTDINFTVTGGGALFQLGAVVTSSQQARLGIQSVDTSSLGGTVGRLYEIGSGQDASLTADPAKAGQIIQAALNNITSLRGQLGAFQTSTIDSNVSTLTGAVTNLTAAQSSIQDADFAAESANLSREQILVQSGTTVAGIASSTPANVLSLLQKAAQV
jgi:flagellin